MNRILFVDDEANVLEGLRRMLYPMRKEWSMAFVASAREALRLFSETEFDVLITDLRMPEMDGLELLAEVAVRHPKAVRLVLSGAADHESALHSTMLAHQYLVKPSDAATIRTTVGRALSLQGMLSDPNLKELISNIRSLPSVPAVYTRVLEMLENPDASPKLIGQLIGEDISMTAKVLHLVNSSFFGVSTQITNPTDAVIFLGQKTVKELILVASVFSRFQIKGMRHFSIEALQQHSVAVGRLARQIAKGLQLPKSAVDQSYVGGLLHGVGKLVLAYTHPEKYDDAMRRVAQGETSERMAEWEAFGTTHPQVGAYLLWMWALPDAVSEVVLRHHEFPADAESAKSPISAVCLSNVLIRGGPDRERAIECLVALGLGDELDDWL